jgi:hypothetical protein
MSGILTLLADATFYDMFAKDIRPGLFTGFLTISGFLSAAHTFIIIHMKKEVYDSVGYKKRIAEIQKINRSHSHYGGLRRLSKLMIWAVFASLATSITQVTVGLYHADWVAFFCLSTAAIAFVLLVLSVWFMALNMRAWFQDLEEGAKESPAG